MENDAIAILQTRIGDGFEQFLPMEGNKYMKNEVKLCSSLGRIFQVEKSLPGAEGGDCLGGFGDCVIEVWLEKRIGSEI